jgi:hypothetical protein
MRQAAKSAIIDQVKRKFSEFSLRLFTTSHSITTNINICDEKLAQVVGQD